MPRLGIFLIFIFLSSAAWASKTSYSVAHPLSWMHFLPVGETPGWSGKAWINVELAQANTWNAESQIIDKRNNNTYTYKADFEQTSVVTDIGFALNDDWAFDVVAPFATRSGGFFDDFIDQFHTVIGSNRFMRPTNPDFGNSFKVQTNGRDTSDATHTAMGNIKLKLKNWIWQWTGPYAGSCDCGFAISGQLKIPVGSDNSAWTSGSVDESLLFLFGVPIGEFSGVWMTAGYTHLGPNNIFADWPREEWLQMYELSMDFAFGESWGLLLQGRMESPLMKESALEFKDTSTDPDTQLSYRVASGWNSLVHWRGSETAGIRWRSLTGQQVNFLIVEDWGIGRTDSRTDQLYVSGAPDVAFVTQLHFHF